MNHPLHEKETVSVGKGLLICKLFFFRLWPLIEPKLPPKNPETTIYEIHEIFCTIVCRGPRASVEWIESVARAKQVAKEKLQDTQLTRGDLFSSMMEFCKIYNKRYEDNLSFLIHFLGTMKEDSDSHSAAWKVFKESIDEGLSQCYSPSLTYTPYLDWETQFSELELLTVEEGFTVCTNFYMGLWLVLDPSDSLDNTVLYSTYYLFCRTVCSEGAYGPAPEGHAEWNEIIFQRKQIPKNQQGALKLTRDDVFLCMVEFCKLYNKKYELIGTKHQYETNLHRILQLLNSMLEHPKKHKPEWVLYKDSIASASNGLLTVNFDWNAVFHKYKYNE